MSKILGISFFLLFVGLVSFGQTTDSKCSKKTSCVSIEQCAKEMGMTKAECEAKCKKQCKDTKTAQSGSSKQMGSFAGYNAPGSEKNTQCNTKKQCVKAAGMTKAECQKKCTGTKSAAKQPQTQLHAEK